MNMRGTQRHVAIAILHFAQHTVLERVIGCHCFYHLLLKSLSNLFTEWLLPSLPMQTVHSKIHHKVSGQWKKSAFMTHFLRCIWYIISLKQTLTSEANLVPSLLCFHKKIFTILFYNNFVCYICVQSGCSN